MPVILSVVSAIALILLLVRLARIERILVEVLGSNVSALSHNLEVLRHSVAPDHMVDRETSLDTDDDYDLFDDRYESYNNDDGGDDPQPQPPFVVREVLATLGDIRKDVRKLRKRTAKQLAAQTEGVQSPETVVLEISVVVRLVRDQDGRTMLPVRIGEGEAASLIPLDVTDEFNAQSKQLNGGIPVRWGAYGAPGNDGYWFFHGLAVKVSGSHGVPEDELMARIKHKAIRNEQELMTILREVEEFERGTT